MRFFLVICIAIMLILPIATLSERETGLAYNINVQNDEEPYHLNKKIPVKMQAVPGQKSTVILANPDDPYYTLAVEISQKENLPIFDSINKVIEHEPEFLLWVVSPTRLSDQILIDFGCTMRSLSSAISVGIISGNTPAQARDLWQRKAKVKGERVFAVNGEYPSASVPDGRIIAFNDGNKTTQSLSGAALKRIFQEADYLTFTGHGGSNYWKLNENTILFSADIPSLSPIVIGTASCQTFRIWRKGSIALSFIEHGAAAYAGFVYSPNEGYLIGEFDGLPFRYTWHDFPVGHAVQVQNQGTLKGFARFPYYYLLGDPRISLQTEEPYRLTDDYEEKDIRILKYTGAPKGFIPVRISGGAKYSFVEIPGVTAAWELEPFYNASLQMVNIRDDKFILFAHQGGDFALHLQLHPQWYWIIADTLIDALDHTFIYIGQTSGVLFSIFAGVIALFVVFLLFRRRKFPMRIPVSAILLGTGFTALQALYALTRLDHVTITSKILEFNFLSLTGIFLFTGCGAFVFMNAGSQLTKWLAVLLAASPALAITAFGLGVITISNIFLIKPILGVGLYNYSIGLMPLITLMFECILFVITFSIVRRLLRC
ncbi:hypothetical protein AMJ80_09940 [bacterium SM23_31]|nr:MAG: hypothetical protein AMJ80_09940 [bacterium SM23_31]